MYVNITLFKTNFTPEDIFVGSNATSRRTELNSLPHMEIRQSAFNPTTPFRLLGNALNYARQWDYVRYVFVDGSLSWERYYFITDFRYINDNCCDMVVTEDIVGPNFYDLAFESFYPEKYTYKTSEYSFLNPYKKLSCSEVYKYSEIDPGFKLKNVDGSLEVGALILTYTQTDAGYVEGGVSYQIGQVILPFLYFPSTNTILENAKFQLNLNGVIFEVKSIVDLEAFYTYTEKGFKLLSTTLCTWLGEEFTLSTAGSSITRYVCTLSPKNNGPWKVQQSGITPIKPNRPDMHISLLSVSAVPASIEVDFGSIDSIFRARPYCEVVMQLNGEEISLNPGAVSPVEFGFTYSFLPPYPVGLRYGDRYTSLSPIKLVGDINRALQNNFLQILYNDVYSEWLQSNYNSQIMGLKTRHESETELWNLEQQQTYINAAASLMEGRQRFLRNSLSAIGSTYFSGEQLDIRQNLNNKLLEYKLADLKNTPDSVAFNGSLSYILNNFKDVKFFLKTTTNLPQIEYMHKKYGFTLPTEITALKSHQTFDYIQIKEIPLKSSPYFGELERAQIQEAFSAGVRCWYSLANFKDYNTANPEITT